MDIQKEREAFEESFKIKWEIGHHILKMVKFIEDSQDYAPVNAVKQMSDEYYWVLALNTGWWAWQAAKAQAVPKGYKVVPVNYECVWCGCTELDGWTDETMIEPQEPAND